MRYIIICEERGVFLGTHEKYGFFSEMDDFGCYKAPSFNGADEAQEYAEKFLNGNKQHKYIYAEFDTKENYISCIDMIKNGYGKHTGHMIENLPNYDDKTIH